MPDVFVPPSSPRGTTGLIVLHNHPSGQASPSVDDVAITRRLQRSGVILGLDLHDHLIAGEAGQYFSLREAGFRGPVSRRSSPRAACIRRGSATCAKLNSPNLPRRAITRSSLGLASASSRRDGVAPASPRAAALTSADIDSDLSWSPPSVYPHPMSWEDLIAVTPGVRGGKPCVAGTRITVQDVLEYLAAGMSESEILADFPSLTSESIRAVLSFAAARERRLATPAA